MLERTKQFRLIGLIVILSHLMISAANASETAKESVKSLGSIPKGFHLIMSSLKFSPDLKHVSYAAYSEKNRQIIRFDNKTSPVYWNIRPGSPAFPPAGDRFGYIAYPTKNKAVCVVDWQSGPEFDDADQLIFSPDGKRFAYRGANGKQQCIVVDGVPGPFFKGIPVKKNMLFSPDSKHFAYVGLTDAGCVLILDGKQQPGTYHLIENLTFSPDSSQLAYKVRLGKAESSNYQVIHNGGAGNVYRMVFDLIFSYDSRHFAYTAVKENKMVLVVDGQEKAQQDSYGIPAFSLDSKVLSYSFVQNKKHHLVYNGEEQEETFDLVRNFYFSLNSSRYAYIASEGDNIFCVVDGEKGPAYKEIGGFKFSWDSSKYAYGAISRDGKGLVVVNGKPGPEFLSVGEPYFRPGSNRLMYKAYFEKEKKWAAILDDKQYGKFYDKISQFFFPESARHVCYQAMVAPRHLVMVVNGHEQCTDTTLELLSDPYYSPDWNHIAYYAKVKDSKWKFVVDGHMLQGSYDGFVRSTPIAYDGNNKFHIIGLRDPGPEFILIEVEIPQSFKLETEIQ